MAPFTHEEAILADKVLSLVFEGKAYNYNTLSDCLYTPQDKLPTGELKLVVRLLLAYNLLRGGFLCLQITKEGVEAFRNGVGNYIREVKLKEYERENREKKIYLVSMATFVVSVMSVLLTVVIAVIQAAQRQ